MERDELDGELLDQHRTLAYLGDPDARPQMAARFMGFVDAGVDCTIEVFKERDWSLETGRNVGRSLVERPAASRPTAVFCANDSLVLGLIHELRAGGVRVAEDVTVVGYDDISWAVSAAVPLTTVRQHRAELGRTAVRLALAEASDGRRHRHEHSLLEPELVVRESTNFVRPVD
jgi:LacI family transcriptional regulator